MSDHERVMAMHRRAEYEGARAHARNREAQAAARPGVGASVLACEAHKAAARHARLHGDEDVAREHDAHAERHRVLGWAKWGPT